MLSLTKTHRHLQQVDIIISKSDYLFIYMFICILPLLLLLLLLYRLVNVMGLVYLILFLTDPGLY